MYNRTAVVLCDYKGALVYIQRSCYTLTALILNID